MNPKKQPAYCLKCLVITMTALSMVFISSGCTTSGADYKPDVDYKNSARPRSMYESDLSYCKSLESPNLNWSGEEAAGALVSGGVLGTASTAIYADRENEKEFIEKCLIKKGWVLNY